jgi:nitroimidazol reductase NimA-like FMN-containing flavoprotein (pyridoxamine 5'-phosphate oxidase superfamily)
MISGLKGHTYEERLKEVGLLTLEERHHLAVMVQTHKIVTGKDMVSNETWFKSVTVTGRATRSADDSLNPRTQACRLDTRRNFFCQQKLKQ